MLMLGPSILAANEPEAYATRVAPTGHLQGTLQEQIRHWSYR